MINTSSKPPVPCSGGLDPRRIYWVWVSEKMYHHSLCKLIQTNMLLLQLAAMLANNFELIYMGKQTKCMMIWCWWFEEKWQVLNSFYLLTYAVWSVCAFINSDILATKLVIVATYLHSELFDYCLLVYMYIFDQVTRIPSQQMVL